LLALIKLACSIPTNAHTYYLISLLKSGSINCTENLPVQPVVSSEARILPLPVSVSTVFSFVFHRLGSENNARSALMRGRILQRSDRVSTTCATFQPPATQPLAT
jgi:hypothetical protein